jgi:2-amino-4-hydroxy-6-hydroxymethyldihydropteridine diphosphokinase
MDQVVDSRENMPETGIAWPLVVGLGANLGDAQLTLCHAIKRLCDEFRVVLVAPLYRTGPIGPVQPDFLNTAALIDEPGTLLDVLEILQSLEKEFHRVRDVRWGPRTLDLDILWADFRVSSSSILTVPHAQLRERAFALQPLLDLVPWAKDPQRFCPHLNISEWSESLRMNGRKRCLP